MITGRISEYEGIYVAMYSAYDEAGDVDSERVKKLARYYAGTGIMPELFCALDRYYAEGKLEEAKSLQFKINRIIKKLLGYPSLYGACKAILALRGVETGQPRLPLLPVGEEHRDSLAELNREIEAVTAEVRA